MEEHLTVIRPVTGYPTHFSCLVCPVTGQIDPANYLSYKKQTHKMGKILFIKNKHQIKRLQIKRASLQMLLM